MTQTQEQQTLDEAAAAIARFLYDTFAPLENRPAALESAKELLKDFGKACIRAAKPHRPGPEAFEHPPDFYNEEDADEARAIEDELKARKLAGDNLVVSFRGNERAALIRGDVTLNYYFKSGKVFTKSSNGQMVKRAHDGIEGVKMALASECRKAKAEQGKP